MRLVIRDEMLREAHERALETAREAAAPSQFTLRDEAVVLAAVNAAVNFLAERLA